MKLLGIFLWGLFAVSLNAQSLITSQRTNVDIDFRIPAEALTPETIFNMQNINGDLNIEGYDGDEVLITGSKIISAGPRVIDDFDPSLFYLDTLRGTQTLFVFIHQPDADIYVEGDRLRYKSESWGKGKNERSRYHFEFNLILKVPHQLVSKFSTINSGNLVVSGMQNGIEANNVNGNIFLNKVNGPIDAKTVNGNISAEYDIQPSKDASFHTINGTIEVRAPKDLSAVVTFKSLQGELYTDYNNLKYLPKRVKKDSDGMTRFSISQTAPIQIGNGGPNMHFQLLNGNAYIKQIQS